MRLPVVRSCLRFLDIVRLETGSKPPFIRLMVGARVCSVLPSSNVRFGSKADISQCNRHVRFAPEADIRGAKRNVRYGPIADINQLWLVGFSRERGDQG